MIGNWSFGRPFQVFAVKIVKKRPVDKEDSARLLSERHINSRLKPQSIVQLYYMFSTVDKDYLVFEYMKGGTMREFLHMRFKRNPLPETYAKGLIRRVLGKGILIACSSTVCTLRSVSCHPGQLHQRSCFESGLLDDTVTSSAVCIQVPLAFQSISSPRCTSIGGEKKTGLETNANAPTPSPSWRRHGRS